MSKGNEIQKGYEGSKAEDCGHNGGIPADTAAKPVTTPGGRKGVGP